jgi:DNA-binding transcriptional LysR family regulator
MDLDTARLRAFLEVAERGTVAAAAVAMRYSAPAVSQQLSKLERQLGVNLFDRVGGRLRLSASGDHLLPLARQMVGLMALVEQTSDTDDRPQHVVIAGFASAIKALVLPLLASRLTKQITFAVHEAEDEDALRDLRLGHVDIALIQEYDGAPISRSKQLSYTSLLSDRLRLIAPPSYPASIRMDQLGDCGWLVNGAGTRCEQATQQVLATAGITPRIAGRVADNATLLALVAAGHGATIAPELVFAGRRAGLTVARIDLQVRRTILGVTRSLSTPSLLPVLRQLEIAGASSLRRPSA